MLRKTVQIADTVVNRLVALLCLPLFLICLYAMLDAANVYLNANDTAVLKYKPKLGEQTEEVLQQIAEDAVAWLNIPDTRIDYPLMQGETNDTYINKDPFGNFSLSGSIFLDSRNSADFTDFYSLVYGHHMDHGAMFGSLDAFYQTDYFLAHRTGTLQCAAGQDYEILFFACCKAPANERLIFDPDASERAALLDYLAEHAAIWYPEDLPPDSPILALSTCQSAETIERLILFGALRALPAEASGEEAAR